MTQEEIKKECELQYEIINKAQSRLEEIRKICTHPNTFNGTYSWRIGCYDPAEICSDCGHMVEWKNKFKLTTNENT